MIPSLLFSGLDFAPQLLPFSNFLIARGGANGLLSLDAGFALNPTSGIASPTGLTLFSILFSWSSLEPAEDCGVALPWSFDSLSVLFLGLRCMVSDREELRIGLSLRVAGLIFRAL